ncbi:MAG: dehydrogenase [Burkholderiales bacterium PBB4]|nr:MAG: dehydrogenase [Burkholderiales bacterium PBB4]
MQRRILLLQGHPDGHTLHLGHGLATSYKEGALAAGHAVRQHDAATLDFPLLRSQEDFDNGTVPACLLPLQADMVWAEHLVIFFPLWAGDMPALLKGLLEQLFRPAVTGTGVSHFGKQVLSGRSARVVVTMAMPALVYRWYFRAHSLKSLERNLLGMVGIGPVHETLIGQTSGMSAKAAALWLGRLKRLGTHAE